MQWKSYNSALMTPPSSSLVPTHLYFFLISCSTSAKYQLLPQGYYAESPLVNYWLQIAQQPNFGLALQEKDEVSDTNKLQSPLVIFCSPIDDKGNFELTGLFSPFLSSLEKAAEGLMAYVYAANVSGYPIYEKIPDKDVDLLVGDRLAKAEVTKSIYGECLRFSFPSLGVRMGGWFRLVVQVRGGESKDVLNSVFTAPVCVLPKEYYAWS
ncbi:uncharacterized protein VTP21DRAFT_2711 [Calcarisporiella thermophila]|uniref:uncharacterized protein n=1 Tax=Calcarisporiella thermophila TaxID=911321 RepID=UPI003741EEFE